MALTRMSHESDLLKQAKYRAKKNNLEFDIDISDVLIPKTCPILNIPLFSSKGHSGPNSPSIDRIDSSKGYVKGNVQVISHKANTIKSNATLQELLDFAIWVMSKVKEKV